jgi:hypothetical protein
VTVLTAIKELTVPREQQTEAPYTEDPDLQEVEKSLPRTYRTSLTGWCSRWNSSVSRRRSDSWASVDP